MAILVVSTATMGSLFYCNDLFASLCAWEGLLAGVVIRCPYLEIMSEMNCVQRQ